MTSVTIELVRLAGRDPDLPLPAHASAGAAGMDVCANLPGELRATGLVIPAGGRALVPTGLAVGIPENFELQMRPRSGLALRHGVTLLNAPGTIDCDYRGEIGVIVINHGEAPFVVTHGMRIAQMVLARVHRGQFEIVETLSETVRGTGGFGSTGTAKEAVREGSAAS